MNFSAELSKFVYKAAPAPAPVPDPQPSYTYTAPEIIYGGFRPVRPAPPPAVPAPAQAPAPAPTKLPVYYKPIPAFEEDRDPKLLGFATFDVESPQTIGLATLFVDFSQKNHNLYLEINILGIENTSLLFKTLQSYSIHLEPRPAGIINFY